MLFGIAGGIGVFAFYYAREDHATFYIAGWHQWHDDLPYLREALVRFGMAAVVQETGGGRRPSASSTTCSNSTAPASPGSTWPGAAPR